MSCETWMKKFYPVTARELVNSNPTDLALVQHALKKWRGLRSQPCADHEVEFIGRRVGDDAGYVLIDDTTCALCLVYLKDQLDDAERCTGCPLAEILGHSCDHGAPSLYHRGTAGDVEPMIEALEKTARRLKKGGRHE